ncbi:MAG: hypothetical protein K0S27_1531 [Gammaproteobacteria bacterium]|jgi:hypothetical protein|nr:hypothetical protein [Gammaproteobacteria bacterium]
MSNEPNNNELEMKMFRLIQATLARDDELRNKYDMSTKFRFVRERLEAIVQQLEKEISVVTKEEDQGIEKSGVGEEEVIVYVYLFNAHGLVLSNWQKLLTPQVFYEYSVNRPIYMEESHVQLLVDSKSNKAQHAYLAVAIKKIYIIPSESVAKDSLGSPLIKIKEGSLSVDRLLGFNYQKQEYILNDKGELVKKKDSLT